MSHDSTVLWFAGAKDLGEIQMASPHLGCQMQAGYYEIDKFQQLACYNWKIVLDRCIVSFKLESEIL